MLKICQSCGMDMRKYTEFGGKDINNLYCVYCTDPKGKLLPREQVRDKIVKYMLKSGMCQEEAGRKADMAMNEAPAWRKK
jgi:hypothetical protein